MNSFDAPEVQAYYKLLGQAREARTFDEEFTCYRQSLPLLPALTKSREVWEGISVIPAIEQGGKLMAVAEDKDGLETLKELVASGKGLGRWRPQAKEAFAMLSAVSQIMQAIREQPGTLQKDLRAKFADTNPQVFSLLEYAGRIRRKKSGSSYALFVVEDWTLPTVAPLPECPRRNKTPF